MLRRPGRSPIYDILCKHFLPLYHQRKHLLQLDEYLNECKINGLSDNTLSAIRSTLKDANGYKALQNWKKEDVNGYLLELTKTHKEASVNQKKVILKRFFKSIGKPEITEHLKIKTPKTALKRDDIITIEEINRMIECTSNHMHKALIAFMFESGARISEILAIKVKDIQETDKGMIVSIPTTKTGNGYRRGIFPYSSQYIRNYITYALLESDSLLFPIKRIRAWKIIKNLAGKAGITKPISPHKFRHAQATDMVIRGYQESVIRKKLGWTGDSRMIARYQHIVDNDVIDATLEKAGLDIPRQPIANLKQADALKIADASMQLSKLTEENAELRKGYDELKKQMELITAALQAKKQEI